MPALSPQLVELLDAVEDLLRGDTLAPWPTREDDLTLLAATRERLERRFTLAVVGEFSSGKSYLLNALLGKTRYDDAGRIAGLLATDINPSTATITELEYGTPEAAVAKYPSGRTERIPLDRLARFVAVGKGDEGALHDALADEDSSPAFVVVSVDSPFLRGGFVVADTPGLASLNPAHRRATLAYLPRTDAVLYLIDTQQPFAEGDAAFLGLIGEHVSTIFIVQTKIDLWQMREADGRAAWEAARERIVERAKRFAPEAEVYSVSARDYAVGVLDDNPASLEASGFPVLLAGLQRSLEARAQNARVARTLSVLRELANKTANRVRRSAALTETDGAALEAERERAHATLAERERALGRERDEVARAGAQRAAWIVAQGTTLAETATRALGAAIDVADIERLRDRGKFHMLVDRAVAPVWTAFASDVAGHVARALERIAKSRSGLRVADLAALRLGGIPGTGAWSRDLASGIGSTIVLSAIGGPSVSFVQGVAERFTAHAHGAYMKRELGADLSARLFPAFEREVAAFAEELAVKISGIYIDVAAAIERERSVIRARTLGPIERALKLAGDEAARRVEMATLREAVTRLGEIEARLLAIDARRDVREGGAAATPHDAPHDESIPFDSDAYGRGLRPERYRIVVLGALRRGKSTLINAIAGTRLLQDDGGREALFPIHVRYGERECAYALEGEGSWTEIRTSEAMAYAARAPVLIETRWSMPAQLVLVHAPAFDSGNERAEEIAFTAAKGGSEILALFSRQLSDRELALYGRVAELGKPMMLAHTIADNENSGERRTVVELASRYLRERGIVVSRIFTISALDYLEAAHVKRLPAAWNELGALRETLQAHAEEHMHKLAERQRRAAELERPGVPAAPAQPKLRGALDRLFGRGR
ncbi:MAG: dynamin family protein [Candidatus Eremiobacteraeota bacterium]|nr:dynamin family protein [Candidatus Eremiobacteraeota bacterium]